MSETEKEAEKQMTSSLDDSDGDSVPEAATGPLYRQISQTLMAEISKGTYPVGSMLPGETELCERFSTSRFTVREALRWLSEHGIVDRRRGSGTVVKTARPDRDFVFRVSTIGEILKYGSETFRSNLFSGRIHADPELAEKIDCPMGKEWYRIAGIRRTDASDLPICWSDIYVDPEYEHIVALDVGGRVPIYEQLENGAGTTIIDARIRIFSSSIGSNLAEVLKVAVGCPALTIVRRYIDDRGKNFETTVTTHPQGRFEISMELSRDRIPNE